MSVDILNSLLRINEKFFNVYLNLYNKEWNVGTWSLKMSK
jgi:hypothetical protein